MRQTLTAALLLFSTAATAWGQQVADPDFDTTVADPAHVRAHPRVAFDEAHLNVFRADGRSKKFVELLENDGYRVVPAREKLSPDVLAGYDILVIATALGSEEWDQPAPAFSDAEIETLHEWVLRGGSLLLMTDHPPFDTSAAALVRRLGAASGLGMVGDTANYDRTSANRRVATGQDAHLWVVFTEHNGGLGAHAILRGRTPSERIRRVLTFGGSSITGPRGSSVLLSFAGTAENRQHLGIGPSPLQGGQATAFELGSGRVVILADASISTAQRITVGGSSFVFGMSRRDFDNRQFMLNVMHWLSRALN